jgi:la-related protein 1
MATTAPTQRSGGEQAGPATFSYAQAAKGLSAPPSSTTSKPSSGSATPAKDPQVTTTPAAGVMNWADDAEAETAPLEPTTSSQESRTQPPAPASKEPASEAPAPSAVSSPDLGASSASTVTKDDDMSSIPNTSSDSTWDNKSQASTSVEKSVDSIEKPSEKGEGRKGKGKGKNVEKAPAKPLTDAPVPMVNIWKQRAEEAKARVVPRPASSRPASVSAPALPNGASQGFTTSAKQAKVTSAADASSSKEKAPNGESRVKAREEEKGSQIRKDTKLESDADKAKKFTKGRAPQEKEPRPTQSVLPLMPARDQEAWPTPETAVDEDRKKANEKTDKVEPEHKESSAPKTKWNKLPITPTVVFNTPMPNGTSSRRGGGRGGRGGAQTGGRPGGFESGNPQLEKDSIVGASLPNGDQSKRGRADAPAQDASPKEKRTMSAGPLKEKVPTSGEKGSKTAGSDVDAVSRRSGDSAPNSQAPGQNNAFPRPYPASRPNKARRGDYSGQDRRKDGDSVSPIKENGTFNGRRNSAATQTEGKRPHDLSFANITYAF